MTWRLPRRKRSVKNSPPEVGDPTLVVVAAGDDEAVASSTALGEAGFDDPDPVVMRLLLSVPASERETVIGRCDAEGYRVDESADIDDGDVGRVCVAVARVTSVDAVTLSRSRARMASIVSRAGGNVVGWALLRRPDTSVTDVRD